MTATLPPTSVRPLGQLLLRRGLIREEQLDRALDEQRRGRHRRLLGEILIDLRDCTEEQVAEALAEAYGIPFARLNPRLADPKALAALPREFVERHLALPLFLVDGVLTVAVAEPADLLLIEEVARLSGRSVQVVAATAGDIRAALRALRPADGSASADDEVERAPAGAFRLTGAAAAAESPADQRQ